jgi:predicted metal-dependent hydrolase
MKQRFGTYLGYQIIYHCKPRNRHFYIRFKSPNILEVSGPKSSEKSIMKIVASHEEWIQKLDKHNVIIEDIKPSSNVIFLGDTFTFDLNHPIS